MRNSISLAYLFQAGALLCQSLMAQPALTSWHLSAPERAIPFVDSSARFWFPLYDPTYGGYYTNVSREGQVITAWGTQKSMLSQTRDAYGFVRAFMLTGDTTFLTHSRRALDFMYASAWDATNGGWYNDVSNTGTANNPTENKTAFYQHYALLGIAAAVEATADSTDKAWLDRGYTYLEDHLWDPGPARFGYYDFATYDGSASYNKSFNATVDAVTTHLLSLYMMTGDSTYKARLLQLADNMVNRLERSSADQKIGIVEKFDSDWNEQTWERNTAMGHVLKTAWCLVRIYQIHPDTSFLGAAERLAQGVLDKGYDHEYGGPYKDYDRTTGVMLMWGQADTAKAWWQMEQAVTAGLMLYEATGKQQYLDMADESLRFFMDHFVDHQWGEVYPDRTRDGGQIWGVEKGNWWKAGYHSTELGYYTYLYGSLLLHNQPATLYYRFRSADHDRIVTVRPLPYASLQITSVTKDGMSYSAYDAANRTLSLPAGTGGIFAVSFSRVPTAMAALQDIPADMYLDQNYPNPFNPTTTIGFRLRERGDVKMAVFDLLGREVAVLVDSDLEPGSYQRTWNATGMASGMYFYRLEVRGVGGETRVRTRKMVLLR